MTHPKLSARRARTAIGITGALALVLALSPLSAGAAPWEDPAPVPQPTAESTTAPTPEPSDEPTDAPTTEPTPDATTDPTPEPTTDPSPEPTPSDEPTEEPVRPIDPIADDVVLEAPAPRVARTFADEAVQNAADAFAAGTYVPAAGVAADALRVEVLHAADQDAAGFVSGVGATNVTVVNETLLVADVPFAVLEDVQSAVEFVRVPVVINEADNAETSTAVANTGSRGSDILAKTNIAQWHAAGYKGQNVKIGIIDYFDTSAWATAKNAGEVTGYAGTFCRSNGAACDIWTGGSAHGTAVAEVLQDMAPSAKLYLATANTTADLKAAVDYFKAQGVTIITRSLATFMDGPGNGTGAADDVVNYAVAKGITWFNSAGNAGVQQDNGGYYYGGYWRQTWSDTNSNRYIDFKDPRGLIAPNEFMYVSCTYFQGLRWSDWGSNKTDYDLYAFDSSLNLIAASELDQTNGAPPIEGASFNTIDCATYPNYYVAIYRFATGNGTANDTLEIMANGAMYDYVSDAGAAGSPISDSKSPGAASIGAVDPVNGVIIGDYSSQGPTNDGRKKPDFSAGSNVASASYPQGFNGTSAATPVAAGAAATVLSLRPYYTPAQVITFLKNYNVIDRGAAGADNVFGTGELKMITIPKVTSATVSITGTVKVGSTLSVSKGTWGPSPVTFTYQWKRNGVAISGATAATYKPTTADAGKSITVSVKGSKQGYAAVTRTSTAKTVPLLTLTVGTVSFYGTPKVGSKLTANPGTWGPSPVTKTYQWKRNGVAITGATASTYTLKTADAGKVITVTVKGSKTGYTSVYKTSAGKTIQP